MIYKRMAYQQATCGERVAVRKRGTQRGTVRMRRTRMEQIVRRRGGGESNEQGLQGTKVGNLELGEDIRGARGQECEMNARGRYDNEQRMY